jgi:hypothetical protein
MRHPISVAMRCAKTGERFQVYFKWKEAVSSYVFVGTDMDTFPLPSTDTAALKKADLTDIKSSEISFASFYCPGCDYGKTCRLAIAYVTCDKCNERICGSSVTFRGNLKEFRCHKTCGREDFLWERHSQTVPAREHASSQSPSVSSADQNLRVVGEAPGRNLRKE